MTTAVSTVAAAPKPTVKVGGAVGALAPQNVEEAFRLAEALSKSGEMIPQPFRGEPMKVMAAIMRGMEVGLAPMQALASIAVINGRASVWGDALPALMQRAGHHIDVEYEGENDKLVAVATLTRGDTGKIIVRRFGMADAKRAGLAGKQGPWQSFPARMCAMRARAWACRDGAADALMGLGITEEASDYGPEAARDVTPPAPAAPRRGGVAYVDPDPVVDEIHNGEVVPSDEAVETRMAEVGVEVDAERQGDLLGEAAE